METWSLPKTRPISCNDSPAFQRLHMSFRCCSESFTRRLNVINTTFREMIYTRWCCTDRLSRQVLSEYGRATPAENGAELLLCSLDLQRPRSTFCFASSRRCFSMLGGERNFGVP